VKQKQACSANAKHAFFVAVSSLALGWFAGALLGASPRPSNGGTHYPKAGSHPQAPQASNVQPRTSQYPTSRYRGDTCIPSRAYLWFNHPQDAILYPDDYDNTYGTNPPSSDSSTDVYNTLGNPSNAGAGNNPPGPSLSDEVSRILGQGAAAPSPALPDSPGMRAAVGTAPLLSNVPNSPAPPAPKAGPTTVPSDAGPDPAVVQAKADLDAAMGRVRESVRANPDCRAALQDKEGAEAEVSALRAKGEDNPDQILPIAHRGLEAGQKIAQIERDAAARDPEVIAAKARLAAAIRAHNAAQGGGAISPN
jgi:hypothetical protein